MSDEWNKMTDRKKLNLINLLKMIKLDMKRKKKHMKLRKIKKSINNLLKNIVL